MTQIGNNQANGFRSGENVHQSYTPIFTPIALCSCLQEAINLPVHLLCPIKIKGVYVKGNGQQYSNGYYDNLKDENSEVRYKIIVSAAIRALLVNNQSYLFTGVLQKQIYNGSVGVNIIITESPIEQKRELSERDKTLMRLLEMKGSINKQKPSSIIENVFFNDRIPSILCVFPKDTETRTEFYNQFGIAQKGYSTKEFRLNFGNIDEFRNGMQSFDGKFDVILVLRGGGSGIGFFSDLSVVEIFLKMKTPILLGVGHGETPVLLRDFVDEWKNNPTDTGVYLREIAERVHKQKVNSESFITKKIEQRFQEEKIRLIADKMKLEKEIDESNKQIKEIGAKREKAESDKILAEKQLIEITTIKKQQETLIAKKEEEIAAKNQEIANLRNRRSGCLGMAAVFIGIIILIISI